MDSAKHAIITMGTLAGTIKHIITSKKIKDIGLVRLKSYRPFPIDELENALQRVESIGILEKDVSLGMGGALYNELRAIRKPIAGFIGGLGGRDIKTSEIMEIFETIKKKKQGVFWIGSKL